MRGPAWLAALCSALTLAAAQEGRFTGLKVDVSARNPVSGAAGDCSGFGGFVGTRGEGKDVFRIRLSGRLPEGVEVRGLYHWSDGRDELLRFGDWSGQSSPENTSTYLRGLQLALVGAGAGAWMLRYRAHVSNLGDTQWHAESEFLGTRDPGRFLLQGVEIELAPRPEGPRAVQLVLTSPQSAQPRELYFLVLLAGEGVEPLERVRRTKPFRFAQSRFALKEACLPSIVVMRDALVPGAMRSWYVLLLERPQGPDVAAASLAEQLEAALPAALWRASRASALAHVLRGDRLIGGFSLIVSLSAHRHLGAQYGALPRTGTRLAPDSSSQAIASDRAVQIALPALGLRFMALLGEGR
jgi:hypothetical protein